MTLHDHLYAPGPKRILALDGGGIRGALTLGYLQRMEDILLEQNGNDAGFTLSDYFDLIGGTSTGSIIAACLAIGMKVADIKEKYFDLGGKIFGKKHSWWDVGPLYLFDKAHYDAKPIETELQKLFGDITLGDDKIKTGLCIVAKRADTNSTWPLINHPGGKYFAGQYGSNKDILLWKAVRASAAAPTYFIPQVIDVGGGLKEAAFVDGGMSMANNPALQLLMVATLSGFPFHWKTGAENLLIVSVGTGLGKMDRLPTDVTSSIGAQWAGQIPDMLMQDASWLNQIVLQWISKSPIPWTIDGEIGDMHGDLLATGTNNDGLISYLRYNMWLTPDELTKVMNNPYTLAEAKYLEEMSHADNRFVLYDLGVKAGETQMNDSHFPLCFKIQ